MRNSSRWACLSYADGLLVMDDSDLGRLIDEALGALWAGDYVRAVGLADQLVAHAPDRAVIRAIRAQALLGADAPEESFREARQAVELDAEDHYARHLLALTAWRTGRLGPAQAAFQEAIKLSGNRPALLSDFAWFMATERGPRPAEEAARRAVAADPESSTAWAALGLAQFRLHQREEAEISLRRALRLDPNDIYAQSAMVAVLQDRHEDAQAEALAGMLAEHAGAEHLATSICAEAKRRRVARMLVERKVDCEAPAGQPRSYLWLWLAAFGAFTAFLFAFVHPWGPTVVLALTVIVLLVFRPWLD
jgi:Tfp pilus assembly protein PilF